MTDQPTKPPTTHEALAELARRLEALAPDATWLPPTSVAQLVREFAETIPDRLHASTQAWSDLLDAIDGKRAIIEDITHQRDRARAEAERLRGELAEVEADLERYRDWSNELAGLVPDGCEHGDPEGTQEGIISAHFTAMSDLVGQLRSELDQARAGIDALRAEMARVRDAPIAHRHPDGSLTVEWTEGQTSCLMGREVLDGLVAERARLRSLLAKALDGWAALDQWIAEDRSSGLDYELEIAEIRREAGLT